MLTCCTARLLPVCLSFSLPLDSLPPSPIAHRLIHTVHASPRAAFSSLICASSPPIPSKPEKKRAHLSALPSTVASLPPKFVAGLPYLTCPSVFAQVQLCPHPSQPTPPLGNPLPPSLATGILCVLILHRLLFPTLHLFASPKLLSRRRLCCRGRRAGCIFSLTPSFSVFSSFSCRPVRPPAILPDHSYPD